MCADVVETAATSIVEALGVDAAWAYVDGAWYRATYAECEGLSGASDDVVVAFYLDEGQARGHSPNPLFDELWYRRQNAEVVAAIEQGAFRWGFEHYCRHGLGDAAPHWLFAERLYRKANPDLAAVLGPGGAFANGYDHFLRTSHSSGPRSVRPLGAPFFDAAVYASESGAFGLAAFDGKGALRHYMTQGVAARPEIRTSLHFDPDWYARRYPEIAAAVAAGEWRSCLHHYLTNDRPTEYDPLAWFSETFYAEQYPDVAMAVQHGVFRNCYEHFLTAGVRELRLPVGGVDLRRYATNDVLAAVRSGTFHDVFEHFLATDPMFDDQREAESKPLEETRTKRLFKDAAKRALPIFGRTAIDFTLSGPPAVSVVIVAHNQIELTMNALASLRENFAGPIELILVDNGSTDETTGISRYVHGAKIIRNTANEGFVTANNTGFAAATADVTLLLNNDVRLGFGAIATAMRRLGSEPEIGAVGAKIVRTNGVLQEAGCILWRNGDALGYMRDQPADAPEANFVRDVDFCSAAFLLVRTSLVQKLGGFDPDFSPAYCEDVDFCLRIWEAGFRVVYDPAVVIEHLEYGTSSKLRATATLMQRGRTKLIAKHRARLRYQLPQNEHMAIYARARRTGRGHVLFIEDRVPLRRFGSGHVRSNDIIAAMGRLGWSVTVFPMLPFDYGRLSLFAEFPDTAELLHTKIVADLDAHLEERNRYYDRVWIARTHNLARTLPMLTSYAHALPTDGLILDTEAVAAVRVQERARVMGEALDESLEAAVRSELDVAAFCQKIVAVNEYEAELIRAAGHGDVAVVGHMRTPAPTSTPWAERTDMLFVGAFHDQTTPNFDSLVWFAEQVAPHLDGLLPDGVRLKVVGYQAPEIDMGQFVGHPRIELLGVLDDIAPLYASCRIFVAPTRFSAGVPYKVHEAASLGLPVVGTDLLARQLSWQPGRDLVCAPADDARAFATKLAQLYLDENLWNKVRQNSGKRIAAENNSDAYEQAVARVLG